MYACLYGFGMSNQGMGYGLALSTALSHDLQVRANIVSRHVFEELWCLESLVLPLPDLHNSDLRTRASTGHGCADGILQPHSFHPRRSLRSRSGLPDGCRSPG